MTTCARLILIAVGGLLLTLAPRISVAQGAEHFEWTTIPPDGDPIFDWNNCTEEVVAWLVDVREVYSEGSAPGGPGRFADHWLFEGTVVGQDTGFVWATKGVVQVVGVWSGNSLVSHSGLIENAYLKPMTEGAPRMRLDVKIKTQYNSLGEEVVNSVVYDYHCVGK